MTDTTLYMNAIADLLPVAEVARRVGATRETVRLWCTKHGLPAVMLGNRRYIPWSVAESWPRPKPGRPRGKTRKTQERSPREREA